MANRSIGNIQQLAEGKYLLRFSAGFDDFGKRIQVSKTVRCANEKEAERLLMEFYKEREKCRDDRITAKPKTLAQLYDEWMKNHVSKLTPNTQTFYSGLWSGHLSDKGQLKLKNIMPKHIYKILDEIPQARTKNGVFKMLKAMFNKAVMWGYMDENPCDRVETPKYKAAEKQSLSRDDISHIMAIIGKEYSKYQAMFYFAALCGLRRQEIVGLKWDDIDFDNQCFTVRRATSLVKGAGTVAKETKTEKSRRKLYLHELLKNALLTWRNEQNALKNKMGDKWHDDNWIFTQYDGRIMNLHTPTNWWKEFVAANDITPITFHGLRHTAATYMIKNNVPISTVSGVLGHANVTTTLNIYTHVIEETKEDAINVMGDVFGGRIEENKGGAVKGA